MLLCLVVAGAIFAHAEGAEFVYSNTELTLNSTYPLNTLLLHDDSFYVLDIFEDVVVYNRDNGQWRQVDNIELDPSMTPTKMAMYDNALYLLDPLKDRIDIYYNIDDQWVRTQHLQLHTNSSLLVSVAVHDRGIYVADAGSDAIYRYASMDGEWIKSNEIVLGNTAYTSGMAIHDDVLYLLDFINNTVNAYTSTKCGWLPLASTPLSYSVNPRAIWVSDDALYVLDAADYSVQKYTDRGPAGADYIVQEDKDVAWDHGVRIYLDQRVYTWTDKVYITIVAPDHNCNSDLVDEIGNTDTDPIKIATRSHDLDEYKLVETGVDTGVFTGEIILTGFSPHDADGDGEPNDARDITGGSGPTGGLLESIIDDGLSVAFEYRKDVTLVASALVRWNIGEVQWLESGYPATGTGIVQVIDPDMNLNPEAMDNFDVNVWSDSDAVGIDLTVTETNESTGIFEGAVVFTTATESSGHCLRVAEGATVTAEYTDRTLSDPYNIKDNLDITATTLIDTIVSPVERAPASDYTKLACDF